MKAKVSWRGNMAFAGQTASGFPVLLDADSAVGGTNLGARPMEMIALGLAGCTAMDVIAILKKKCREVTQFEVRVDAPRAEEHPRVFTSAVITYIVSGRDIDETSVLRAIELTSKKYCPAQAMLGQVFPIDLQYEIYEDDGDGHQRLTHQGTWQELVAG
jgi:putative redox protein